MAQVSYGTITITDTNDIERIYPVYCKGGETTAPALQPLSNWSEIVSQAGGTGNYIWQRIVTKKQDITVTINDYSDAVRLTGDDGAALTIVQIQYAQTQNENDTPSYGNSMPSSINEGWWLWVKTIYSDNSEVVIKTKQGQKGDQGYSVTNTRELYYLKTNSTTVPQITNSNQITNTDRQNGWTSIVPSYVTNGNYYTCIETTLNSPTNNLKWSAPVENKGLTSANQKALDAYNTSIARDTEVNALKAQAKHYWWDSQGAHVAAGENTTSVDNITQGTPSTYGFNSLMAPGYLALKYKDINFAQLATNSLTFYRPATDGSTYVQGKKGMDLTADALTFYKPLAYNSSSEPTAAATLNSNGLILSEGGVQAGTAGQSGFIYLSTKNYGSNLTINSHQASNWREIIGTKFGVDADGTLYATNAVISGTIAIGSGSTIDSGATVGGTSLSNIAQNASTGAQAASDLSAFETTVSNTYATQEALSDVEEQIPDVSGLASKTDTVKSVTTETQYRLSNSSTSLTGSGTGYTWSTTIPTWSSNKYLWTRIATTYTPISGNATTVYKPGTSTNEYGIYDSQLTIALSTASSAQTTANGAAASVTTTQQYNLSSSISSANGTWQDTVPTWSANNYIWVRLKIVKTPMSGTATTSYTPSESGTYDKALTTALSTAASAKTTAENAAPKSSAIAEEQRIYYRSNAVSNNSPIKPNGNGLPTTWITETGDKYNSNATTASGWSKKITPIANGTDSSATKYLYLWTCIQRKTVSGDVTYGDILLDDSTTVIDGGKIITGSVSANSINASSGTFDTALIPQLTISKIDTLQTTLDGKAASGAENTALSYLSYDSTNGLKIAGSNPSTTTTNYIQITSSNINIVKSSTYKATIDTTNGLLIYAGDASNAVAQFGSTMRIGKEAGGNLFVKPNEIVIQDGLTKFATFGADGIVLGNDESMRAEIDSNSFELKDIHGESWFKVEDQRDPDGTKTFTETVMFTSDTDVEDLIIRHPLFSVTSLTLFNSVSGYTTIPSDQYTFTQDSYTIEILGEDGIGYIEVEAGDHITIVYKSDVDEYRSYTLGSRATGLVGKSSYVLGYNCTAQQDYATAIGEGTNTGNSHEVVVGKYNGDANASGALYHRVYAFEVGNGTDDESRSNAFAVDWDGYVDHYNDGVFEVSSAIIGASTGTFVSGQFARYGTMVQMQITFRNTASTASGSNIFECSFDPQTPGSWLPVISARGCAYYGAHALVGTISPAGNITIRNASSTAVTIGASNSTTITFTYVCDPHR